MSIKKVKLYKPLPVIPLFLRPVWLLILLFIPFCIPAQTVAYLGMENGLSNNTVTSVFKDRRGFMWFGTFDGLNRYDGYNFTKFRRLAGDSTTLPDNYITAIEEDAEGRLWVGTKKGAAILNEKSLSFSMLKYRAADKKTMPLTRPVTCIKRDQAGRVFIATEGAGLLMAERGAGFSVQISGSADTLVRSIETDRQLNIWFLSASRGLCLYTSSSGKVRAVAPSLKNGNCLKFDLNGLLWTGTNAGLYIYNKQRNELAPFRAAAPGLDRSRIMHISLEAGGKLWVSTDGDGVSLVDGTARRIVKTLKQEDKSLLSSNSVYAVFSDQDHRIWIATMRGGINIIDPKKDRFRTVKHEPYNNNSLIHNTVMSFCEDGDNIWIGTDGGGISVWNRRSNSYRHHVFNVADRYAAGANQVPSIIKDEEQNIWIATYGTGVKKLNRANGRFEAISFERSETGAKYVWKLFMDSKKEIWAGCIKGRWAGDFKSGLFRFDRQQGRFVSVAGFPEVLSMTEDRQGNLWTGTLTGVTWLNKKTGKRNSWNIDAYVRDLYTARDGKIWIGTYGRGLWMYDPRTARFRSFTEEFGLPNNVVVTVEEDRSGFLWLGTFNGLSKFNPKSLRFENFYATDGLQSNQFNYNASLKLTTGEMLFGGIRGFNIFNPDSIRVYKNFPGLFVTGIKVLNSEIRPGSEFIKDASDIYSVSHIVLPYEKSMLSIDLVALEYSLPDKIQYAYYLDGWDKAWNYVNNLRTINYSRLNEGTYTLRIRSTNSSGIWNAREKIIKITVLPPWYRSWWACCFYMLAAGSLVYGYVRYQRNQARLHYEVKLANLKAVQEAELNEKKSSFFTNIAHEIRTPLTLIVNPIKDLLNNDGKNINLVDISAVYRNTRRLLSLADQLLLFKRTENEVSEQHPEVLDLADVCNEVFLCFTNQVKAKAINYNFECFAEHINVFADREKVEIVLFNLLSNAVKYTPEKGTVTLYLGETGGDAEILVKDSGPGIPEEAGERLFDKFYRVAQSNQLPKKKGFGIGLFISRKIADQQAATLTYSSSTEGTVFRYKLPRRMEDLPPALEFKPESAQDTGIMSDVLLDIHETRKFPLEQNLTNFSPDIPVFAEHRAHLLIIDDDDELRSYIRQMLLDTYTVSEAENADLGFTMMRQALPDLIICDVVMPGTSGVEFCLKTKESKEFGHIPLILLTGTSSPEVKLKGIECGADDYVTKPFEKDMLLARIKSLLKGRDSLRRFFFNEVTLQKNNEKVSEEYRVFLRQCIEIVEKHLRDDNFNVKVLAKEIGTSHSTLYRKVKSMSDLSVTEFIRYIRLKKAAELMINTDMMIKEIAYVVGFEDIKYFREQFSKVFGLNPSGYIKKYRYTLRSAGN